MKKTNFICIKLKVYFEPLRQINNQHDKQHCQNNTAFDTHRTASQYVIRMIFRFKQTEIQFISTDINPINTPLYEVPYNMEPSNCPNRTVDSVD